MATIVIVTEVALPASDHVPASGLQNARLQDCMPSENARSKPHFDSCATGLTSRFWTWLGSLSLKSAPPLFTDPPPGLACIWWRRRIQMSSKSYVRKYSINFWRSACFITCTRLASWKFTHALRPLWHIKMLMRFAPWCPHLTIILASATAAGVCDNDIKQSGQQLKCTDVQSRCMCFNCVLFALLSFSWSRRSFCINSIARLSGNAFTNAMSWRFARTESALYQIHVMFERAYCMAPTSKQGASQISQCMLTISVRL